METVATTSVSAPQALPQKGYRNLISAATCLQSPVLLLLRLYWGWEFFMTGKGKLASHEKIVQYFQSLHIPMPGFNAWLAGGTECIGGLLLLLGLGARLASLPLIFLLIIAYVTAESGALKAMFSDPDKFTGATPFLFLEACVIVLAFGPGVFSFDWVLEKTIFGKGKNLEPDRA